MCKRASDSESMMILSLSNPWENAAMPLHFCITNSVSFFSIQKSVGDGFCGGKSKALVVQ